MKRIIAEVVKLPSGSLMPMIYCVGEDGSVDAPVTETLLSLLEMSRDHLDKVSNLIEAAKSKSYVSPNPELPDWGFNDVNLWLVPPMAKDGCVCVSNENTLYSADHLPQQFSFDQVNAAFSHWRLFLKQTQQQGLERLHGQRFEVPYA